MPRSNVAVDQKIAYEMSDEATKANKTFYAFMNESLDSALKVYRDGGNPSDIYPSWRFAQIMKDIDAIPIPGDLLERMIKRGFERQEEKDWFLKIWFEEGRKLGAYLQLSAPRISDLTSEARALREMLPVKRVEFKRATTRNTGEEREDSRLFVRAVGAGLSTESTDCAAQFLRGIIAAYSLHVMNAKISEGIIEFEVES